jgi:hypothetical protein
MSFDFSNIPFFIILHCLTIRHSLTSKHKTGKNIYVMLDG